MPRPYIRWEPGANADLIVKPGDGPLILTDEDGDKLPLVVGNNCTPPSAFNPETVGYVHRRDAIKGTSPQTGLRVRGYDYLVERLSFYGADPVAGEPHPGDRDDGFNQWYYDNLGWRMPLRGILGSLSSGGLNLELRVDWADEVVRNYGDARGAWTGAMLHPTALGQVPPFLFTAMHGKRSHEMKWIYHGMLENPSAWPPVDLNTVPWNGVDSGRVRFVVSGGSPSWKIVGQYWDGASWQDLNLNAEDLIGWMPPSFHGAVGLYGYLFSGPTALNPGKYRTPIPELTSYFNRIEVSQFQPFILDTSEWDLRHVLWKTQWLFGDPPPWGDHYGIEPLLVPYSQNDLAVLPPGSGLEPRDDRVYDQDVGWAVRLGQKTLLAALGPGDRAGIFNSSRDVRPLCFSDMGTLGINVPFVASTRWKFENMHSWTTRRGALDFGFTIQDGTAPDFGKSGIGFFWEPASGPNPARIIARIWDSADGPGVWTELTFPFEPSDWDSRPVDIAVAWTGARGTDAGQRPNYEYRLVVNGRTVDSIVLSNSVFIEGTSRACVGSSPLLTLGDFSDSVEGLFVVGACYFDAMTDYQIEKSLSWGTQPFVNPSFETAADDDRPGEADHWDWHNVQQAGQWADFNSYDVALNAWYRAMEDFEAGWDDNQAWIDLLESLDLVAALFNASAGAYQTTAETFDLWSFPDEHPLSPTAYTGPPWRDDFQVWRTDDEDQPGGPVGFQSWYDALTATVTYPRGAESFEEAWDNEPLSTAIGPLWQPGSGSTGRVFGDWFELPVTIPPDRSVVWLQRGSTNEAVELQLTAGTYTDITSLDSMLIAALAAAIPGPHPLEIGYETDVASGRHRICLGWDQITIASESFMLMTLQRDFYSDAREILGLDAVGPGGRSSEIEIPASTFSVLPLGVAADDVFIADVWSYASFAIVQDPYTGLWFPLVYDQLGALFDTAIGADTYLENFLLQGWFGVGATWKLAYTGLDLDAAVFDFGTVDQGTIETFIDTRWPDEIWT